MAKKRAGGQSAPEAWIGRDVMIGVGASGAPASVATCQAAASPLQADASPGPPSSIASTIASHTGRPLAAASATDASRRPVRPRG